MFMWICNLSKHFLLRCPLYNSIRNKTVNKIDANERNINTLLFGDDQLHLDTKKDFFAVVHDFVLFCLFVVLLLLFCVCVCVCQTDRF